METNEANDVTIVTPCHWLSFVIPTCLEMLRADQVSIISSSGSGLRVRLTLKTLQEIGETGASCNTGKL